MTKIITITLNPSIDKSTTVIAKIDLATGIPRVYEFAADLKLLHVKYLS